MRPPRFPKGTLANWDLIFAREEYFLEEAKAKDAAIQAECMPLRKRYAQLNARRQELRDAEWRARHAFAGLAAWFHVTPNCVEDELRRLDNECNQLRDRIFAIAGTVVWVRPKWGSEWREWREKAMYDVERVKLSTPLDLPLDTAYTPTLALRQAEIDRLLRDKPSPEEDAACRRYQEEHVRRAERKMQREATKPEREAKKAEREAAKKRKAEAEQAAVASATGKAREHADKVKRSLRKDHDCPYCGSELGSQPHADHIYPVSKGGRSVAANMVHVCAECNLKKGDLTLAAFVIAYRLDRDVVEWRLQRLGKEY